MTMIEQNLQAVCARIAQACASCGRNPHTVALLAVSKTFGAQALAEAFAAGQRAFGENYVQEALDKMAELAHLSIEWHCIGPLQSNKTRQVAQHFSWVHSVDRLKIAQRLSEQRPANLPPLQVLIQVNVDDGPNKSGVAPQDALDLARAVALLPRLCLRGVMAIPEPQHSDGASLAVHAQARAVFERLRAAGLPVDTLSLGMSADLEAAIAQGSTMVRVGSALFGNRVAPTFAHGV